MNDDEIIRMVKEEVGDALKARIPTKERLLSEYKERLGTLLANPRKSMDQLRALQSEYVDKEGITDDDLDVSPKGKATDPRLNNLSSRY